MCQRSQAHASTTPALTARSSDISALFFLMAILLMTAMSSKVAATSSQRVRSETMVAKSYAKTARRERENLTLPLSKLDNLKNN